MTPQWTAKYIVSHRYAVQDAIPQVDGNGRWWVRVLVPSKAMSGSMIHCECEAMDEAKAHAIADAMKDDMLRQLLAEGAWEL